MVKYFRCVTLDSFVRYFLVLNQKPEVSMLWVVFAILIVLWIIGIVSSASFGGFIHILLIAAVIVVIVRLIKGKTEN
jgi:hypothetical protein